MPSRDCIHRLLIAGKLAAFQPCFQAWIWGAIPADSKNPRRLVAIDGKGCRESLDEINSLGILPIVNAWAHEESIAQGQVTTVAKPKLVRGCGRVERPAQELSGHERHYAADRDG